MSLFFICYQPHASATSIVEPLGDIHNNINPFIHKLFEECPSEKKVVNLLFDPIFLFDSIYADKASKQDKMNLVKLLSHVTDYEEFNIRAEAAKLSKIALAQKIKTQ